MNLYTIEKKRFNEFHSNFHKLLNSIKSLQEMEKDVQKNVHVTKSWRYLVPVPVLAPVLAVSYLGSSRYDLSPHLYLSCVLNG